MPRLRKDREKTGAQPEQLRVRVTAGVSKESCMYEKGVWKVSVRTKAHEGAANARMQELLARALGVSPNRVRIVRGHRTPNKLIVIG